MEDWLVIYWKKHSFQGKIKPVFDRKYYDIARNYQALRTQNESTVTKKLAKQTNENTTFYFAHAHCCSKFIMRH
jgi:hypothetical protein